MEAIDLVCMSFMDDLSAKQNKIVTDVVILPIKKCR